MSYEAPYLDKSGLHLPTYKQLIAYLVQQYKNIFGQDVYIEPDTQDYQLLSLYAKTLDEAMSATLDAYNARNVNWATGTQLDTIVSLNGLRRLSATYSTVVLTMTGIPGSVIKKGVQARDDQGYTWETIQDCTLNGLGKSTVNARCTQTGSITAEIGTINYCQTPSYTWTAVTNDSPAVPGRNIQTDEQLRQRRAMSVSSSATSTLDALTGALVNLQGVTSVRVTQNAQNTTDSDGIPAHSICVIIKGGNNNQIASVIYNKRSPGIGTYGNVTVTHKDKWNRDNNIKFSRPTSKSVTITINLKKLQGFDTVSTPSDIKAKVKSYVEGLDIGENLTVPYLYAQAYSANTGSKPTFVITGASATDSTSTYTDTCPATFDSLFSATVNLNIT